MDVFSQEYECLAACAGNYSGGSLVIVMPAVSVDTRLGDALTLRLVDLRIGRMDPVTTVEISVQRSSGCEADGFSNRITIRDFFLLALQ